MRPAQFLIALTLGLELASLASPASAGGIALRWTNCVADGGTSNVAFACNTNTGFRALVPSFVLETPVAGVTRIQGVIDVVASGPTLPEWWVLQGGCRSGSISATLASIGLLACSASASGDGISSYEVGAIGPNTARLTFAGTNGAPGRNLGAGIEYVVTALRLNLNRTVGSPSCAGCLEGVCLTLNDLTFTSAAGTLQLTTPFPAADGTLATWQGGGAGPGGSCSIVSPARRSAWGAIKSLYR